MTRKLNQQITAMMVLVLILIPAISVARFISVDPLADEYPGISPYAYVFNNPLTNVDPDGRGPVSKSIRLARKVLSKRLLEAARKKAVRRAWAQEKKLLESGFETSMRLTAKEKDELLRTGKVTGWEGHHVNSVSVDDLQSAVNPMNVEFVKGRTAHLEKHGGNWRNKTSGPLIDRLSKLGASALIAFFMAYDAKLKDLLEGCKVCSDDDAWHSYINPLNAYLENAALVYAYAAAAQAQEDETKESKSTSEDEETPNDMQR